MRAIGPPLTDDERNVFVAAAFGCANKIRFRHQGRNPKMGLDCSGLVAWSLAEAGRIIADVVGYNRDPHMDKLHAALVNNLGEPVLDGPMHGDVVEIYFDGQPRHVGIIADHPSGGLMLVHSYAIKKMVVAHRYDKEWQDRTIAVFRP